MKEETEYRDYVKHAAQPMRPYVPGEDLTGVSVQPDTVVREGDMIAINPEDPTDKWVVKQEFFLENYEAADAADQRMQREVDEMGDMFAYLFQAMERRFGKDKKFQALRDEFLKLSPSEARTRRDMLVCSGEDKFLHDSINQQIDQGIEYTQYGILKLLRERSTTMRLRAEGRKE